MSTESLDFEDIVIPPRPEGGYPDEFFAAWNVENPEHFGAWFGAYHLATGDESGDFQRWMDKVAATVTQYRNGKPTVMRNITVRLPEEDIARLEAEGGDSPAGRSGIIRQALDEHWSAAS